MRVVITNSVALNGGDGAILESIVRVLRDHLGAATEFVAHDSQPDVAARYYRDIPFRPALGGVLARATLPRGARLQRSALRHAALAAVAPNGAARALAAPLLPADMRRAADDYRASDVIVSTGGTYLVEHYDLSQRLLSIEAALTARKPLILYTQSLGPFHSDTNRAAIRDLLPRAALVLLRDQRSLEYLKEAGVPTENAAVAADVVFAMADPARLAAAARAGGFPTDRRPRVAISVREWAFFRDRAKDDGMRHYVDAVRQAVTHLVDRYGAEVTFLSTCQGIPEYWTDDSRTAVAIAAELPARVAESVTVDRGFYHARALIERLSTFDLAVTTRMHMAIMSLDAGTPVLPIAYEFKTRELFAGLGHEDLVHDIDRIAGDELVAGLDALIPALPRVRAQLFPAVEAARRDALASGALVREALGMGRATAARRETAGRVATTAGGADR
jgi:colanic acid/amylovoran biosynthesis protein